MVGMSGAALERLAVVTASARNLPDFASGSPTGIPAKYSAICPVSTSPAACGPPLYVTCTMSSPVMK